MLILASASPRRSELLNQINCKFVCRPTDCAEISPSQENNPEELVKQNAILKATAAIIAENKNEVILGADTVVAYDGQIYGKPKDDDEAYFMLKNLSGHTHQVYTGIALVCGEKIYYDVAVTDVTMKELTDEEIHSYIKSGEPHGKAGAYAIQGLASVFIKKINGCYFNVVGLPLSCLYDLAKKADVKL